ncbi:MAG: polysaccharide deacetylase family protein [Candidatus Acidiferrales bacterium]|jgi:peptidoglycan-N-acetylglucosamine deacetylase
MHRRAFLRFLERSAVVTATPRWFHAPSLFAAQAGSRIVQQGASGRPQVALTMDDPKVDLGQFVDWKEANTRILGALDARKVKAALFVAGKHVDRPGGKALLGAWDDAGHLICNHSYSHLMYLRKTTYEEFAADFLRDEPIIAPYRNRTQLFRYPFLKEGDTAEKRDRFRALLKEHGYRVGHVTLDTSDWYVNDRMEQRLQQVPGTRVEPYGEYLVAHLLDRASYYRQLALDVLGHEVRHTLLVHYSMINALFLQEVMAAFEKSGWEWIDADHAYEDPVFRREPQTLPAGESLIWALAAETGKFKGRLRWPGEDDTYEKPKMDALGL